MSTMNKDFQAENWWTAPTISGGGTYTTTSGDGGFWWEDKDRHRSGVITHSGTEYGEVDMYNHSTNITTNAGVPNHPIDVYLGRKDGHSGAELDAPKLVP